MEIFDRLQFKYDFVLYNNIGNEISNDSAVVMNLNSFLFLRLNTSFQELDQKRILIDALQETESQVPVHFESTFNDFGCKLLVFHK